MKKFFLLSTILLLLFVPFEVKAISNKEAATKMNDYIYEAVFNNTWQVSNYENDTSRYTIRIDFNKSGDTEFQEVIDKIPLKAFSGTNYKASIYLVSCDSYTDADSCLANSEDLAWNASGIVDFDLKRAPDGTPYLYAVGISPEAYKNVTKGNVYYNIQTNQKGSGGNIEKEGVSSLVSSPQDDDAVDKTVGTYTNPDKVLTNTTIKIPAKNASIWKGQANICYYFTVDFSSVNTSDNTGRYKVSPITEDYGNDWVLSWVRTGQNTSNVLRDAVDNSLFAFSNENLYAICNLYGEESFYGASITFTYKDSKSINLYGPAGTLNGGQIDEKYINNFDGEIPPDLLNGGATDENWDQPIGCEDIFDTSDEGSVGWLLMTILNYVRVIGPIAVILLSALDFIKAIMSSDEKAMKQAQSKLVIRLVAALALFLIPTLVGLLLDFINATNCANTL